MYKRTVKIRTRKESKEQQHNTSTKTRDNKNVERHTMLKPLKVYRNKTKKEEIFRYQR